MSTGQIISPLTTVTLFLVSAHLGSWRIASQNGEEGRRAAALTTSTRHVGVGAEIAADIFPETATIAAVPVYGLVQLVGAFIKALW